MGSPGPTRGQGDLADMVEMLLDKGVVINADIAVSIGDTELLGVQVRAALASFETAAEYGLEFPEGTDMERVAEAAAGRSRRQVEGDSEGGAAEAGEEEPETGEEEAEREAATEATVGGGSADDGEDSEAAEDGDDPVPSDRNRVAVRPQATTGDGSDEEADGDD